MESVKKTVKFNLAEWQNIQEQMDFHKITFSEFARESLVDSTIASRNDKKMKLILLKEVNKIGVNLNQMTKAVNGGSVEMRLLLAQLVAIENELHSLFEKM